MKLRWHGHDCFEITDGITIVTDPHDGKAIGIRPPQVRADLVLVSHDHFDHNCVRIVKGANTEVVTTSGKTHRMGVEIVGIPSFHDDEGGAKRGQNIIFKFAHNGITFCHLGDLGHVLDDDAVGRVGNVDILFLPVGGVFTIDADKAWEVLDRLRPRIAVPMHYRVGGLSLHINPVKPFLDKAGENRVVWVGNEVDSLSAEELPDEQEIWVFSL